MNKKTLLKTLLPIASVALIGGGIASSLILSSCSKGTILTVNNYEEYLANHVVKCDEKIVETDAYRDIIDVDDFFAWLSHNYTKQVFVNSLVTRAFNNPVGIMPPDTFEIKSDSFILKAETEIGEITQKLIFEKWNGFNDHVVKVYTPNFPVFSYTISPTDSFQNISFDDNGSFGRDIDLSDSSEYTKDYLIAQTDLTDLHFVPPTLNG